MSFKPSTHMLHALRATRPSFSMRLPACRLYSTPAGDAPPPLLSKLKADLKTAMRAKDTARLNVLRAIMSANLNASKTATPIRTDVQLVGLIRKLQKSSNDTIAEAKAAGREDLATKEEEQNKILAEYAANSGVQTLGEAELRALAQEAVDASKAAGTQAKSVFGDVMRRLSAALEGKDVDKKEVAKVVKELTA